MSNGRAVYGSACNRGLPGFRRHPLPDAASRAQRIAAGRNYARRRRVRRAMAAESRRRNRRS